MDEEFEKCNLLFKTHATTGMTRLASSSGKN